MAGLGTKIQEETWRYHGLQSSTLCVEAFITAVQTPKTLLWNNHHCTLHAEDAPMK